MFESGFVLCSWCSLSRALSMWLIVKPLLCCALKRQNGACYRHLCQTRLKQPEASDGKIFYRQKFQFLHCVREFSQRLLYVLKPADPFFLGASQSTVPRTSSAQCLFATSWPEEPNHTEWQLKFNCACAKLCCLGPRALVLSSSLILWQF